jgi:hypothetical protein
MACLRQTDIPRHPQCAKTRPQPGHVWPSTEQRIEPTGIPRCCRGQRDRQIGGERRGMLVQGTYVTLRVGCDNVRHLGWAPQAGSRSKIA